MDGYILGARDPFCVPVDQRVRWQGVFEDDSGMLAFSDIELMEARYLAALAGGVLALNEPIPDYPPSWPAPTPIRGLKHKKCLADTIMARYIGFSPAVYDALAADERVQGAAWTNVGVLLVEFGSDGLVHLEGLPRPASSQVLVHCRDYRTELVSA